MRIIHRLSQRIGPPGTARSRRIGPPGTTRSRRIRQRRTPLWIGMIARVLVTGAVITGLLAAVPDISTLWAASAPAAHATAEGQARQRTPVRAPAASADHATPRRAPATVRAESLAYVVRPGDTLSSIARRLGGRSGNWTWLYSTNRSHIHHPDLIYPGEVLTVPGSPPAASAAAAVRRTGRVAQGSEGRPSAAVSQATDTATAAASASLGGTLGCSGLEALWERAGGSASQAAVAASIAMAESSGDEYATGPVGERGYWQINPVHGSLSTYDPQGNARAAVILSADGADWSPWTTYTDGAYSGRC